MKTRPSPLRSLPAVETLLNHPALAEAVRDLPRPLVVEAVRAELGEERRRLRSRSARSEAPAAPDALASRAAARAGVGHRPQLRRVLNATGVVLHTNLGRAPLSAPARRAVDEVGRGYSSLEFDLESGGRGDRGIGPDGRPRRPPDLDRKGRRRGDGGAPRDRGRDRDAEQGR